MRKVKRNLFITYSLLLTIFSPYLLALTEPSFGVKTYIWGEVKSPGSYLISYAGSLLELISLAGGPTASADLSRITIVTAQEKKQIRVNLKKNLSAGELLILKKGDVVLVPRSFWAGLKEAVPFITAFGVLLNIYLTYRFKEKK